mmetsp:Transcript_91256/g.295040  ORF Transcript_91256/g.295040 Transcript_91256/m.295040 type:complete len:214 (+) Transcript_91256:53-694(+)
MLNGEGPNSCGAIILNEFGIIILCHLFDFVLVPLLTCWVLWQLAASRRPTLVHGHGGSFVKVRAHRWLPGAFRVHQHRSDLQAHDVFEFQRRAICLSMEGDAAHAGPRNRELPHTPEFLRPQALEVGLEDQVRGEYSHHSKTECPGIDGHCRPCGCCSCCCCCCCHRCCCNSRSSSNDNSNSGGSGNATAAFNNGSSTAPASWGVHNVCHRRC